MKYLEISFWSSVLVIDSFFHPLRLLVIDFFFLDEVENAVSLYCEINYDFLKIFNKKKLQFFQYAHSRCLASSWIYLGFSISQRSEYTRIVNVPGFWICLWFGICQGSRFATVLIIPELHRALNMPQYPWMVPGYDWLCLNVPNSFWMAFVFRLPIVIPCLK